MTDQMNDRAFFTYMRKLGTRPYPPIEGFSGCGNRPPAEIALPIDTEIAELIKRRKRPRIDLNSTETLAAIGESDPYRLARSHLAACRSPPSYLNRDYTDELTAGIRGSVDKYDEAIRATLAILGFRSKGEPYPEPALLLQSARTHAPLLLKGEALEAWQQLHLSIAGGVVALMGMRDLLASGCQKPGKATGRHLVVWKKWFVRDIGFLWTALTQEKRSHSRESMFADFVTAAWNSLGPEMREQSFDLAIEE